MERVSNFVSPSAARVPLRHAFEAFALRCQAQNLTPGTCLWYKTRHYVNLGRRDVAEQHKKFSPMEGLLGRPAQAVRARPLELAAA